MIDVRPEPRALARPPAPGANPPPITGGSRPRRAPSLLSLVVLLVGALATTALALASYLVNTHNDSRLLHLQTRQTASVLQGILPTVQTPLASAAEIGASTGGNPATFKHYAATYVGPQGLFTSMSLWRVNGATATWLATVGSNPRLAAVPTAADRFLSASSSGTQLGVQGLLGGAHPTLGYAYGSAGPDPSYVAYGETALPPTHRTTLPKGSPFADLNFALYLGPRADASQLLESNVRDLPMSGDTAQATVPFGSTSLTLIASAVGPIGGSFSAQRWWIIALLGGLITAAAGLLTDRLVRGRRAAETLTHEVEDLLLAQRTIAETLQRALLPTGLPSVAGVEIAGRYLPGVNGIEIGGDWYDVLPIDDTHFVFAVGDVSGRGLEAGSVMASLHFAIRGFVSEGHDPATVLHLLSNVLDLRREKHFATVLCGLADVTRREITFANAGHLPPLVIDATGAAFVATKVGPPIGVPRTGRYETVTIVMPPGSTLLAYTDGLVERRDETLDDGLERLRVTAAAASGPLETMLSRVLTELTPGGADDDTAMLGLRWS